MKITLIVLASLILLFALAAAVAYLIQKQRQNRAERDGAVVYATVLAVEAVGGWAKKLDMRKITMRVQEPDSSTGREVTLRSRLAPGQKIIAGHKLMVVIDPTNPQRIYPATPEAAKRVVLTGSRQERRLMQKKGF